MDGNRRYSKSSRKTRKDKDDHDQIKDKNRDNKNVGDKLKIDDKRDRNDYKRHLSQRELK